MTTTDPNVIAMLEEKSDLLDSLIQFIQNDKVDFESLKLLFNESKSMQMETTVLSTYLQNVAKGTSPTLAAEIALYEWDL